MALPNQTDKTKDTQTLAEDVGQNAPLTPIGAQEIGATSDQSKMMGTPAQVKANLQMQEAEQESRLKRQEKEAAAEQARLGGQLLSQQERYVEPTPTEQQQAAGQIAETMRVLGPVQARVQGLIQARLAASQSKQATTVIDEEAATEWLEANGVQIQRDAQGKPILGTMKDLLTAVKDAKDPDSYEKALSALYDTMYGKEGTEVSGIPEGFGEAVVSFFKTTEESIKEAATPTGDDYVAATLGKLDLSLIGITDDSKQEIADALGISVEAFDNLTLDELNTQIASLEANELSRVEELRNMLEDPTISFAMKKSIYDELRQLGAAGVVGAEQEIQTLQDQIDEANTIEILGETYTLEEALSDDGLSELIARAASDEKLLQAMKDTPGYQSLAQWVETNKTSVKSLLDDYGFQSKSFVEVQREYKDVREILGKDEESLNIIKAIAGIDGKFSNSMTTEQFELFKNKITSSSLFKVLYDGEAKKIRGGYNDFLTDLKKQPDLLAQFTARDEEGNLIYSEEDIKNTVALKEAFVSEGDYFSLLYGNLDGYLSREDYDAQSLIKDGDGKGQLEILYKWKNSVTPEVKNWAQVDTVQKDAINAGKVEEGVVFLDVDDLVKISEISTPAAREDTMEDITTWLQNSASYSKKYKGNESQIKTDILGTDDFDWDDFSTVYKNANDATKKILIDIFDTDGKDGITQDEVEAADEDTLKNLMKYIGLGEDVTEDSIISDEGAWELKDLPSSTVSKTAYEVDRVGEATNRRQDALKEFEDLRTGYLDEYGFDSVRSGKNVTTAANDRVKMLNDDIKKNAHSSIDVAFSLLSKGEGGLAKELHNLRGNSLVASSPDDVATLSSLIDIAEGRAFSKKENEALARISRGEFSKFAYTSESHEINSESFASDKKMLEAARDKLAETESLMTTFIDDWVDLKMPGAKKRLVEQLEAWRSIVVNRKNAMNYLLDRVDAEDSVISQVGDFQEFHEKFYAAEKAEKQYSDWYNALSSISSRANYNNNSKIKFNGKDYTFKELVAYGTSDGRNWF